MAFRVLRLLGLGDRSFPKPWEEVIFADPLPTNQPKSLGTPDARVSASWADGHHFNSML